MKFSVAAFATVAGAFVIPDTPDQVPLRVPQHSGDSAAHHHNQPEQHRPEPEAEPSWLDFVPGANAIATAYDEVVHSLTAGAENAAHAVHEWVDQAIADTVAGDDDDDDDDHEDFRSRTIYQIINDNEHTTRFAALINKRPHLVELLNSTETNSTVFVPVDEAFKHVPKEYSDEDEEEPFTDKLVLYHIGLGNFPVNKILDTHTFPTALTEDWLGGEHQRVRVRVGFTGVKVNFYSKVLKAAETKNGIVAAVRNILVPPPMVGRELSLFPDHFSTLLLAYDKTDFVSFIHDLHMTGTTVFAPSNDAFHKLGKRANAFLFSSPRGLQYLKAILKYGITPNATLYSDAFYDKTTGAGGELDISEHEPRHFDLPTLLGDAHIGVDIGRSWGFITMRVNGAVKVSVQDGIAKNGVIHVVNRVPLPPRKEHDEVKAHDDDDDDEEISVDELKERLAPYVDDEE